MRVRALLLAALICFLLRGAVGATLPRPTHSSPVRSSQDAAPLDHLELSSSMARIGDDPNERDQKGRTALMRAADAGIKENFDRVLAAGADVNAKDPHGFTAFSYLSNAYFHDYVAIANVLLDRGASPKVRDTLGSTPLHMAVALSSAGLVQRMLDRGADPNARDRWGQTPLMEVRHEEDRQKVELLLAHGALLRARDKAGKTVLMHLVSNGCRDGVRLLIDRGADVKSRDRLGRTALMSTDNLEREGDLEAILDALLTAGARVDEHDREGKTALILAGEIPSGQSMTGGFLARRLAEALLSRGADINARSGDGTTALIAAAKTGHREVVHELLARGADPNLRDRRGVSALAWVARYHEWFGEGVLAALRAHGARIGIVEALLLKDHDTAARLLEEGAEVEAGGPLRQTPLMLAAEDGYPDLVDRILDHGARVDVKDEYGMTPLHFAVQARPRGLVLSGRAAPEPGIREETQLRIVRALLNHHADVNAADNPHSGVHLEQLMKRAPETAVQWAARWNYAEIVKALLERGADIHGQIGRAALHYAKEAKADAAAELLRSAGAKE